MDILYMYVCMVSLVGCRLSKFTLAICGLFFGFTRGVSVPPDQQGPINIRPCNPVLPPSSWESRWELVPNVTTPQPITLRGSSGVQQCLTAVPGTAYHSFNDEVDVKPCNSSDSLQLWSVNSTSGLIVTQALPADLARINRTCGSSYPSTQCALDVNNHQSDAGTTLQLLGPPGSGTGHWAIEVDPSVTTATSNTGAVVVRIKSTTFKPPIGDNCVWHTPDPKPPPPPDPVPKPICDVTVNCTIVSGATTEILRLNAPYAPSGQPYKGQDLLYIRVRYQLCCREIESLCSEFLTSVLKARLPVLCSFVCRQRKFMDHRWRGSSTQRLIPITAVTTAQYSLWFPSDMLALPRTVGQALGCSERE